MMVASGGKDLSWSSVRDADRSHPGNDSARDSQQRLEMLLITQWPVQLFAVIVLSCIYLFVTPHNPWFLALAGGLVPMLGASFWCVRQVRHGQVNSAVLGQLIALWVLAVTYTAIAPIALPCFVAVVMLGAVVALPHLTKASLATILIGSTLVTVALGSLGELQNWTGLTNHLPGWVADAVLIGLLPVPVALAAIALWNYRGNLIDALEDARRTTDELRHSRQRVVAAGDAERRRIERDLHDGAQQSLMAIMMKVRSGRYAISDIDADLKHAVDELRSLAHGIYPPVLANRGLVDALKVAADRSACPTSVKASGIGRYPEDIESAAYFCCLEGLQNVARHAGPNARTLVQLWKDSTSLWFSIADDGAGFETENRHKGVGLANMIDRVGAAGGQLTICSVPGAGTQITGSLPL